MKHSIEYFARVILISICSVAFLCDDDIVILLVSTPHNQVHIAFDCNIYVWIYSDDTRWLRRGFCTISSTPMRLYYRFCALFFVVLLTNNSEISIVKSSVVVFPRKTTRKNSEILYKWINRVQIEKEREQTRLNEWTTLNEVNLSTTTDCISSSHVQLCGVWAFEYGIYILYVVFL